MKIFNILLIIVACIGCENFDNNKSISNSSPVVINSLEVIKDRLELNGNEGVWYYKSKPFSGYAVRYYNDCALKEKVGFYNGKKEGKRQLWFKNGVLKMSCNYNQNKIEGVYKTWWDNGVLASQVVYVNGFKEGIEQMWYNTGVLAKKSTLLKGKENGMQQAWLQNGKMYVNYEAKQGRIFGMKRANSCYQLEDEVVKRSKKL